jgi:hypothetical protein
MVKEILLVLGTGAGTILAAATLFFLVGKYIAKEKTIWNCILTGFCGIFVVVCVLGCVFGILALVGALVLGKL